LGLLLLIAFLVWLPSEVKAPKNLPFQELEGTLILIQGNSLSCEANRAIIWGIKKELEETITKYPELERIIFCESSWREDICSYKGCNAGMGLSQIIPSTLRYCEKKLGKELNPFNGQDNLECAIWLYENEGTKHWKPSRHCWDIDKSF